MKKLLTWILVACALLPLVVTNGSLVPYISGKTVYLRLLISAAAFLVSVLFFQSAPFRKELVVRAKALATRPLFWVVAASYVLLCVSTVFAFDTRIAFFGNLERGEGLVGITFFYLLFLLTTLVFEKTDWNRFFGATLATGWIMFIVQLIQSAGGNARPGALTGNPIFLGAYFLFVIYAGLVLCVRRNRMESIIPKFVSISTVVVSTIGIFITQDRAVILGAVIAVFAALGYLVFVGKGITATRKHDVRTISATILIVLVFFSGLFFITRHAPFWQHVPGFSRIASFNASDDTSEARLINIKISLHSVVSKDVSITRSLFGWGWDNYIYAWEKFYNPSIYGYDSGVFDRAHNKLLDVIVMTGVLGLLAYLTLWALLVRAIIRIGKNRPLEAAAGLFFTIAFFLQNLTVFDSFVTFLVFFAMLAVTIYESRD